MKIALLTTMSVLPWAGSEELWSAAATQALRNGHTVALEIYHWPSVPLRVRQLASAGATILRRPVPRFGRLTTILDRFRRPFAAFETFGADVLCISQGGTYDLVGFPEYPRLKPMLDGGLPYVVVCQANDPNYVPDARTRDATIAYFARATCVAFVSEENRLSAERQLATALPNARVIQNPVNLTSVEPLPWPHDERVPADARLATVARIEAFPKGQDVLLESLHGRQWRDRDWRLDLVGEGRDKSYLRRLSEHYGIADRVAFTGQVTDLRAMWADRHLMVLSTRSEGTPLALVEAMLCGRPAVVTDVGGNADWIEDGVTGFVAEAATAKSFGGALERAWTARDQWEQMGTRAHAAATAKFDREPGRTLLNLLLAAARPTL